MSLNPIHDAIQQAGLRAFEAASGFKPVAESALTDFRSVRADLERKVRRGELTLKVAREQAAAAAARIKDDLTRRSSTHAESPRVFFDRLVETIERRKKARESMSLEGLQRETNKMLRQLVIEQQLQTRSTEFESKTFTRPVKGGEPAPSLDKLLAFHETASLSGDEAAKEWARRMLESFRNKTVNEDDQRRIDLACDRPDVVNPRLTQRYIEVMKGQDPESLERFAQEAIDAKDANACTAAFLLARGAEEGTRLRWVRHVLNSVSDFPDSALQTLRRYEAESKAREAEAALGHANYAATMIDSEARLSDVQAPSELEVERVNRVESLPIAQPGEAIGLVLERRGRLSDDPETPIA